MAIFTSKAVGNWGAEGQTTWNEVGHPVAADEVTIQNGHTVTLNNAAACYKLTVSAGGILTDATNNVGLIVGYTTKVYGTLTCGSAAMSFGSGHTLMLSVLDIKAGGTFNGGSGNHTVGAIESSTATSTLNMTSGNCTVNGSGGGYQIEISSNSSFAHNNGTITLAYNHNLFIDTHSIYNLVINQTVRQGDTHLFVALTIANDLTVTLGTLECDADGAGSHNLTVGGNVSVTDILDGKAAVLDFNGNITINGGGELIATSGNLNWSGTTWMSNGTFTHGSGTVILDGTDQEIDDNNTWHNFTKSITTARTLTIDNASTQIFGGTVTLNGAVGQLLSLISDSDGNAFNFTMSNTATKGTLSYLSVKDSDASGSDAAHKPIAPTNSNDVSGNTDWFGGAGPPPVLGKGGFKSKRLLMMAAA